MATAKPAKNATAAAEKATYIVISALQHDKVDYVADEPIELTEAEAAPLLGHTVMAATNAAKTGA